MKKIFHKIKDKWYKYNLQPKVIIALIFSCISFSSIGMHYNNNDLLYYLYLISASLCFSVFMIILPVDKRIKDKIRIRLVLYPIMSIITLVELFVYSKIYFGDEIQLICHLLNVLLLIPVIIFFIDVLQCFFKFVSSIINLLVKETNSKFINILKNITSIIITVTAFFTAIINFAKLFSEL